MRKVISIVKRNFGLIFYSFSSIVKACCQLVVSFFIAKFISPDDLGLWATLNLFITYSSLAQGGIVSGLSLDLPYKLGQNKTKEAEKQVSTSQVFILWMSFILFLIGLIIYLVNINANTKTKAGIIAVAIMAILTFYQNFLIATYRSKHSFERLTYIQIFEALFNLVTIILIIRYLYYGLLIKSVLTLGVYGFLLHFNRPFKIKLNWDFKIFKSLLKLGFPIFILVYIDSLSSTVDKLWILKFGSMSEVGLYSFAFYGYTAVILFTTSIASYIYPKMSYEYGASNNPDLLWMFVKKLTGLLLLILLPFGVFTYLILPYLVVRFFPLYIQSVNAMQLLIFAAIFKGAMMGANALWSMRKWKLMYIYQLSYSLLLIVIPFLFIKLVDGTLFAVSIGVLIANVLAFFIAFYLTFLATRSTQMSNN